MTSGSLFQPPAAPAGERLLGRILALAGALFGLFLFGEISVLLSDFWFMESLGLESVFWTNFRTGAALFAVALVVGFAGVAAAGLTNPVGPRARRFALGSGALAGLVGAYFLSGEYLDFLLAFGGTGFGQVDPIFGKDIGFYVFTLPGAWTGWWWALSAVGLGFVFALTYAYMAHAESASSEVPLHKRLVGTVATPLTLLAFMLLALLAGAGMWLTRFDLLVIDNYDSSVFGGAEYIDVTGLFSTLNYYSLTAVILVLVGVGATYLAHGLRLRVQGSDSLERRNRQAQVFKAVVALVALDLVFRLALMLRDVVFVTPNEPVIQLEYIERHIEGTRHAFGLDQIETLRLVPGRPGDPLPDLDSLLASPTVRNAPLWPGFVSRLERLVDPQHAERILLTEGDATVYGPTMEIMYQQEKLRPYYDFLDVDAVRYRDGDGVRMMASAVRELPLIEPVPWLAWWGQRFVLFTHGWGLVATPSAGVSPEGEPLYAVRDIPARVIDPALALDNPAVYYGEGSRSVAYSNVRDMDEFDYPTDEGRATVRLSADVNSGVRIDSFLKRLVFGWESRQFFDIVFSSLIESETRIHYYRTPLERIGRVAPFLHLDSDPYAVVVDGGVTWIVNGMTYTDRYPYSQVHDLGDKSDERAPIPQDPVKANYVRDAIKATVDAFTGQIALYRISDDPVTRSWAQIYPELFQPGDAMPDEVRAHLQYPVQLFHAQFDDVYILYQMNDPMTFFNMEDMWDDGDEVLGPVLDQGEAITFSIEPYHWVADATGHVPAGAPTDQFALTAIFTPQSALNLRAMPTVYQDGEAYGKIVVHQVPKGIFVPGPEQADAAIDQDPEISQQFAWWNRTGMDVIRGHTTALLLGNELVYVEPIFLRSRQNPATQMKQVSVYFRSKVTMRSTLEEALRTVWAMAAEDVEGATP